MSNSEVVNAFSGNGASPGGSSLTIPDFSNVEVKNYYAKPGSYPAVLTKMEDGVSAAQKPKVVFHFDIDVGRGLPLKKQRHCSKMANALWSLMETCESLGIESGKTSVSDNIGKKCTVHLIDKGEYQGKTDCAIDSIDPPGQATGAIATVDTAGPALSVDDDDIPF